MSIVADNEHKKSDIPVVGGSADGFSTLAYMFTSNPAVAKPLDECFGHDRFRTSIRTRGA
jgi:hypothetical protein